MKIVFKEAEKAGMAGAGSEVLRAEMKTHSIQK